MSAHNKRLSKDLWERHKHRIIELYRGRNLKVSQVQEEMAKIDSMPRKFLSGVESALHSSHPAWTETEQLMDFQAIECIILNLKSGGLET